MGYTTDFTGNFQLSPQPTPAQEAYINQFAHTRRVRRNAEITKTLPDPIREAVGLPVGTDGAYYVADGDSGRFTGKAVDLIPKPNDIIDINTPPGMPTYEERKHMDYAAQHEAEQKLIAEGEVQPSLWCQWVIDNDEGKLVLAWDGGEKFYNYAEWLQYLIKHFFSVWGIEVNGEVEWQGEDSSDFGLMVVEDSVLTVKLGKKVFE